MTGGGHMAISKLKLIPDKKRGLEPSISVEDGFWILKKNFFNLSTPEAMLHQTWIQIQTQPATAKLTSKTGSHATLKHK